MRRRIYEITTLIILISILLLSAVQATAAPVTDASVMVTAIPDYAGGGGNGGNGNMPGPDDDSSPGEVKLRGIIDRLGVFMRNIVVESADGRVRLFIYAGTVGLIDDIIVPEELSITRIDECPCQLPSGVAIVGGIYDIGPGGLHFSEGVSITITYDETWLADNTDEGSLYIAECERNNMGWQRIANSTVDVVANKVTAAIDHFAVFAILAELPVLPLQISELVINPAEVTGNQIVNISVMVINPNAVPVTQTVSLMIGDRKAGEQIVTLAAGESKEVSFQVSRHLEGAYSVNIGPLTGTFTVTPELVEEPMDTTPPELPETPMIEEPPVENPPEETSDIAGSNEYKSSFLWYLVPFLGLLGFAVISWYYMRLRQHRGTGYAGDNN